MGLNVSSGIGELRRGGVSVYVKDGRFCARAPEGRRLTYAEVGLCEHLRDMNAEAVAWLQAEQLGGQASKAAPVALVGVSIDYGLAIGRAIKDGAAELIGKVRVHTRSGVMDLTYRPLKDFDPKDYMEQQMQ